MRQAVKCVKMAKLVTLQLHFLNHGQELRVINLKPSELQSAIVSLPRCYQVLEKHTPSVSYDRNVIYYILKLIYKMCI